MQCNLNFYSVDVAHGALTCMCLVLSAVLLTEDISITPTALLCSAGSLLGGHWVCSAVLWVLGHCWVTFTGRKESSRSFRWRRFFVFQAKPTQNTNFTEIHPVCNFRFFENTKITHFTKIIDQESIDNENKLIIVFRRRKSQILGHRQFLRLKKFISAPIIR